MLDSPPTKPATLSAPLKVAYLLICISKQASDNFKVSTPIRPDTGMDLCLTVCVCIHLPMCVCVRFYITAIPLSEFEHWLSLETHLFKSIVDMLYQRFCNLYNDNVLIVCFEY